MGYFASTNLVFGVRLESNEAKKFYEKFSENDFFSFLSDEEIEQLDEDDVPYEIDMWSDGADSRIHDLNYEKGAVSYVGILLTDKAKEVPKLIKTPPKDIFELYEKYVKPKLESVNIQDKPDFHVFNQTI